MVPKQTPTLKLKVNHEHHGPIIVQRAVPVLEGDTPAARVFEAECDAYPEAIRLFEEGRLEIVNGRLWIR